MEVETSESGSTVKFNHFLKVTPSLAHVYHVGSTSVNTFVSYPAHRQTDRQTDSKDRITLSWRSKKVSMISLSRSLV